MKALGSPGNASPSTEVYRRRFSRCDDCARSVWSMNSTVSIDNLAQMVPDGARLGIGGVHLSRLPVALIQHVLSQGKKNFVFTSWGGGLALELFLEAGAVRKLIFCFSSLDIFGL